MATAVVTAVVQDKRILATWAAESSGDVGQAVDVSLYMSIAVQCISGTIGTSTLQGSQDGVTFGAIGAGVTIPATNGVVIVAGPPKFVRPNVGASGAAAVIVLSGQR